jgi:hypothetical protein
MKYFLSFIALFLWSCVPSTVAVDRQSEELNKKIITLQTSNLSLKEKETAYRNMITEGQIGLRNLTQQERDDEIASARKTALYCSLFSILGVVAAAILFYLRSTIFAMIMLVGRVDCSPAASFMQASSNTRGIPSPASSDCSVSDSLDMKRGNIARHSIGQKRKNRVEY